MNNNIDVKQNHRDLIVQNIIKILEQNPNRWSKTWTELAIMRPQNPTSGTMYSGVNLLLLGLSSSFNNFNDNRWCTYIQAKNAGLKLKEGQKSCASVVYRKSSTMINIENQKFILKSFSQTDQLSEFKSIVLKNFAQYSDKINTEQSIESATSKLNKIINCSLHTSVLTMNKAVFNFSQFESVPPLELPKAPEWDDFKHAESLLQNSNVKIIHDQYNMNFYRSHNHEIHLTLKSSFKSPEAYYSTAFHELAHAKMRDGSIQLNTDITNYHTDNKVRAREELRAELSSIFICAELGINYDVQNHTSYIHSWIKLLKEDSQELWSAVADSNNVVDSILELNNILKKPINQEQFTNNKLPELMPENNFQNSL